MRHSLFALATLVAAGILVGQSPMIYSNGPLATEPHGSVPGALASRLQSGNPPAGLDMDILGFTALGPANAIADDFLVCANGMVIDGIEVFGYLTGSVPAPPAPVTGVFVEISSTDPSVAITPVPNSPGLANDQLVNSTVTFSNIYRVTTTTLASTDRPIMSMRVNLANPIVLAPGIYWLIYQFTGTVFSPPVTALGAGGDGVHLGNALQRFGAAAAFAPMLETGFIPNPTPPPPGFSYTTPAGVSAAFNLYGLSGNVVGSITNSGQPSCGLTTIQVTGAPVAGGFVQTTMSTSNPGLGFALLGHGFGAPLGGFCGCVVGHDWSSILTGLFDANGLFRSKLDIPNAPFVCGLTVHAQGAELLGLGGCASPPLTFTDTYDILISN